MEPKTLTLILLRVLAVYLLAKGVLFLPEIATAWAGLSAYGGEFPSLGAYSLVVVAPVVFGLILWAASDWLAKLIVRGSIQEETGKGISLGNIQAAVLATVGLLLIFATIPSLISIGVQVFGKGGHFSTAAVALLSGQVAKVLLGLVLVTGTNSLVRFLQRFREFGLDR